MGTVLTEVDNFDTDITVPIAGDLVSAPVLTAGALQKLTNRTRNLLNRISGFITGNGAGATYTPTGDPITIQGTGLHVVGTLFRATGDVEIGSTDSDTLTVTSTSEFDGPTTVLGAFTVGPADGSGPAGTCWSNFTFLRTLGIGTSSKSVTAQSFGTWTHTGNFNATGGSGFTFDIAMALHTHSDVTLGGSGKTFTCEIPIVVSQLVTLGANTVLGTTASDTVTINATPTLATPMQFSGAGRVPVRYVAGALANHTYAVADGNTIKVSGSLGGGATYTMDQTGAQAGDFWVISNHSSDALTVDFGALGPIVLPGGGTTWCELVFDAVASTWVLLRFAT